jgi:hypothetical protein
MAADMPEAQARIGRFRLRLSKLIPCFPSVPSERPSSQAKPTSDSKGSRVLARDFLFPPAALVVRGEDVVPPVSADPLSTPGGSGNVPGALSTEPKHVQSDEEVPKEQGREKSTTPGDARLIYGRMPSDAASSSSSTSLIPPRVCPVTPPPPPPTPST